MRVLITGATGFVGGAVQRQLMNDSKIDVSVAVRSNSTSLPVESFYVSGLTSDTDWSAALQDKDLVIHCAARAHIMSDDASDPLSEYRRVNVDGTLNLARQAAKEGLKRFVFISSIKVNGEQTQPGQPFTSDDQPAPEDAYGQSKLEAEQGLQQIASEAGMELVIIRPPLVYGPEAKGNFSTMIKLVDKGLPLPLGAIHNKRSLIALDNLVDLVITCIDHPAAANQVFLAGDGQDLSTTELLRGVGNAMGKPARLIPVPAGMLMFGATLLGKRRLPTFSGIVAGGYFQGPQCTRLGAATHIGRRPSPLF